MLETRIGKIFKRKPGTAGLRARQAGLQEILALFSVMLCSQGYFDCCCCVMNYPRTCCKETTFCFAPHLEGHNFRKDSALGRSCLGSPKVALRCWPDLPSSERMSLDQI